MRTEEPDGAGFAALFDRSDDYAALLDEIRGLSDQLNAETRSDVLKQARKLRKTFAAIMATRLLRRRSAEAGRRAQSSLELAATACSHRTNRIAVLSAIKARRIEDYKGRVGPRGVVRGSTGSPARG